MAKQQKGILGEKLGMTQVWDESNKLVPVTVVKAGPCVVTQVRTPDKDGYDAVQIAFGAIDPRKVNKPLAGHFARAGVPPRRHVVEIRTADASTYQVGQELTADLFAPQSDLSRTVELPESVFDVQVNVPLIHQVVVAQLAAARQGTADTKSRAEVRGGGKKPYRQKGTGRARQGSTRAPQFAGGGVVHGPQPRDYSQRTPKKMIAAALRGALSDRARNERIHAVTELVEGQTPSTKSAKAFLATLTERKQVLVVIGRSDEAGALSVRNLPGVHILTADQLNTYDVLKADDVVFSVEALNAYISANTKTAEEVSA